MSFTPTEEARAMFREIMAIPNESIRQYFEERVIAVPAKIDHWVGGDLRIAKMVLAHKVVERSHGFVQAMRACADFNSNAEYIDPEVIPEIELPSSSISPDGTMSAAQLLLDLHLAASISNACRRIQINGLAIGPDKEEIVDPETPIAVYDGLLVRPSKCHTYKVKITYP